MNSVVLLPLIGALAGQNGEKRRPQAAAPCGIHLLLYAHRSMRKCWLIFVLAIAPAVFAAAPDLRPIISREAAKCAAAVRQEDLPTIVSFLPVRVVQKSGGRAAMIAELRAHLAEAHDWGADHIEAVPGKPAIPQRIAQWLAAFVPVTAIVHSRFAQLVQETHVLALSSDHGQHWSFVPMYETTQAQLNAWFPEFRGRVLVPVAPKPRMSFGS